MRGSSEPEFLTFKEPKESIPRNHFRQPEKPGGPVRQPYSYSVPSPHRLFKNFQHWVNLIIEGDMGDATSFRAVFFVCVGGGGGREQVWWS